MKTLKTQQYILIFFSCALVIFICATARAADTSPEPQGQGWQDEFEYLCARTQDSAQMSAPELKSLVDRCDRLMPEIEKLEEPKRKPLARRLKMSRDFYQFMLEQKQQEGGK